LRQINLAGSDHFDFDYRQKLLLKYRRLITNIYLFILSLSMAISAVISDGNKRNKLHINMDAKYLYVEPKEIAITGKINVHCANEDIMSS